MTTRYALVAPDGTPRPGEYRRIRDAIEAARIIGYLVERRTYALVWAEIAWRPDDQHSNEEDKHYVDRRRSDDRRTTDRPE